MVGESKILTVSYGTFSCTLEGFEDSFSTMKAIAEYFRDLAAEDRYFGAEPPTPDADLLARIAEKEVNQRVEAQVQDQRVLLRAQNTPSVAVPAEGPQAELGSEEGNRRDDTPADFTTQDETATPEEGFTPVTSFEEDDTDNEAANTAEGTSVAAKLQRIRAVVARNQAANTDVPLAGVGAAALSAEEQRARAQDFFDVEEDAEESATFEEYSPEADTPDTADTDFEEEAEAEANAEAAHLEAPAEMSGSDDGATAAAQDEQPADVDQPEQMEDDGFGVSAESEFDEDGTFGDDTAVSEQPENGPDAEESFAEDQITSVLSQFDSADPAPETDEPILAEEPPEHEVGSLKALVEEINGPIDDEDGLEEQEEPAAARSTAYDGTDEDDFAEETDRTDVGEAETEESGVVDIDEPALTEAAQEDADDQAADKQTMEDLSAHDDVDDSVDDDTIGNAFTGAETHHDSENGDEPTADKTVSAAVLRARARVIKVRKTDLEEAEKSGEIEEMGAASQDASITVATDNEDSADEVSIGEQAPIDGGDPFIAELDRLVSQDEPPETSEADTDEETTNAETPATPDAAASRGREVFAKEDSEEEASVARLLEETNNKLDNPETSRRRSAISHLRAAVAATVADRLIKRSDKDENDAQADAYRNDLASVVKPKSRDELPSVPEKRTTPLVLVSEQRIDRNERDEVSPAAATRTAIQPRRVGRSSLALKELVTEETADYDNEEPAADESAAVLLDVSFEEFASVNQSTELPELVEAASAYLVYSGGQQPFNRAQVLTLVADFCDPDNYQREDGLRAFGQLLRDGRIIKIRRGKFELSEETKFRPSAI